MGTTASIRLPPLGPMHFSYRVAYYSFRALYATYFRWRVFHPERIPATGPVILASNHASFMDPPLIGAGIRRRVNYLARNTLFKVPVVGAMMRSWRVVPVDREGGGAAGLKGIWDRLSDGGVILLFPEGTRTDTGRLRAAKSGVGLVVIKSTAPVVPVRVFGSFAAYGRHLRWPRPRRLMVKYGHPLDFRELRAEARTCSQPRLKEIYQATSDQIMAAIARLEPCKDVREFP